MGTTSHVLKDYIINHYDVMIDGEERSMERNGVVKLKVYLGLMKIYGQ